MFQLFRNNIKVLHRIQHNNSCINPFNFKIYNRNFHRSNTKCDSVPKLYFNNKNSALEQKKDVLLFVSDNKRYLRLMNLFALSQFVFWTITSYSFSQMKPVEAPTNDNEETKKKEVPWYKKMDISAHKDIAVVISFIIGWGLLSVCWLHTLRSVKHIVLRKGGTSVTMAVYTPFETSRYLTVPLEKISAKSGRIGAPNSYIALKIQGKPLHYLLDSNGNFVNPLIYDKTVGINRKF